MPAGNTLAELRAEIDALDGQLLNLISARARLAQRTAALKQATGDEAGCYRPEREARILERITRQNRDNGGPLPGEKIARLFREIMSACLALEQPLNIAYLGPAGTFTQTAALKHFGHSVQTSAFGGIEPIFREVEAGGCHYGVVPVENSIEGAVNQTLDLLHHSSLLICGEVELRIHHHLFSGRAQLAEIKRIYSHQQSLAQCRGWLAQHLPGVERVAVASNAEAARLAAEGGDQDGGAAIAGETAGGLHKLTRLAANIEDRPDNTTRFLVIGKAPCPPSGRDKTSLIFSTANRPGALHRMLNCFAEHEVSMTRIESRPSRREMWDYVFFADIEGHVEDAPVKQALADLEAGAALLKLLGSYPQAAL